MKKKLKGLLSLWLAVVLVLGTPTVPVLAETSHGNHTEQEWKSLNSILSTLGYGENQSTSASLSNDKYFLTTNGEIPMSTFFEVPGGTSATICLNSKKLDAPSSGYVNVLSGSLTMVDCSAHPGTCSAPIHVVYSGSVLNIQGGEYTGGIDNESGTWNIGVNAGSHTQVQIADINYNPYSCEPQPKIEGNFNLRYPTPNYYTNDDTTKVFTGWAVSLNSNSGGEIIDDTDKNDIRNLNWEQIRTKYSNVWEGQQSGSVYLADRWADGHTVTYDYNDNSTPSNTVGVVSGDSITLETPIREGYTFKGWCKENETDIISGDTFTPTENTVLTAKWMCNLTYNYNDGTISNKIEQVEVGKNITLETPANREGYRFDGWCKEGETTPITGNTFTRRKIQPLLRSGRGFIR